MLRKRLFLTFLLLLLLTSLVWGNYCFGESKKAAVAKRSNQKKVVMVILNAVGIDDFTSVDTPWLYHLANKAGAVGLMNTRTAAKINPVDNYLTIGAGVKAAGGAWGGLSFNATEMYGQEKASDVYQSRTGIKVPDGMVVNLAIADVSRWSYQYNLDIYPGSLGRTLKDAGYNAAVLGNSDVLEQGDKEQTYHREAALIAMDHLGRVPFGNVSQDMLSIKPQSIGGLKTNYRVLFNKTTNLLPKVDFLVIETGDTARVDEFSNLLLDWEIPKKKKAALRDADRFVEKLTNRIDLDQTLLIVVSPTPSKKMEYQGNNLNPIILVGPDIESGVLTSATTRRHGIVDNTDIAPTIISFFGGQAPFYMAGRSLKGESQSEPVKYLTNMLQQILIKSQMRVPVLTTYVTAAAIILLVSLILLLIGEKVFSFLKYCKFLLLWAISVPVAMLLTAAFSYSSPATPVVLTMAFSLSLVILASLIGRNYLYPVLIISLLTCVFLVLDTVTGAHLMQGSLLGYCPMIGARFYGIGNEYMGVLIGSSVVGLTLLFDVFKLRSRLSLLTIGLLFVLITFIVGYQGFGANVGGAIGCVVAFSITYIGFIRGRISSKHLIMVGTAVLLFLVGLAALDLWRVGGNSHLGRAIVLIQKGGFAEAVKIIQRKLAMNIKGTRYTAWTRILIASLVVLPTLFLRPVGAISKFSKEYTFLTAGIIGSACGAIVSFFVNDTGAAVAATIIVFSAAVTLYIMIEDQLEKGY